MLVRQKANSPNVSHMADDLLHGVVYEVWDLPCYICETNRSIDFAITSLTVNQPPQQNSYFISYLLGTVTTR